MSRRDTIIVAVLINTGLLAVLFMMAMHTETPHGDILQEPTVELTPFETPKEIREAPAPQPVQLASRDELDEVLKNYSMVNSQAVTVTPDHNQPPRTPSQPNDKYVEVTVKRGDFLERIARANGTTVGAIMRANNMLNARIDIGQVLKVPVGHKNEPSPKSQIPQPVKIVADADYQHYTLKSGDNPWKIAKQFHVKFDDLLKMNDLDEEKARNLKPGDVLRVK